MAQLVAPQEDGPHPGCGLHLLPGPARGAALGPRWADLPQQAVTY